MKNSGVEWIGEIPDDWEVTPLKKLFSFGKGLPITKENLVEKGLPVISYGQIHSKSNTGTKLQSELLRYVSNSYLDSNPNSLVHSGDFIFADTSEDLEGCGNCCYIDKEIKLFAGYHTVILQSKISKDNKYLAYLFKTDEWRKQLREKLVEVKLYSITQKALKSTSVILPPKETQQRIASYLDKKCSKIEETIQNQQQVIEKLKAYKQSLITEAVTGKVKIVNGKICGEYESYKDSGVEWIGKIPSEWDTIRIKWLLNERKERSEEGKEEPLSMSQKYGLIPTKEMETIPNMASTFVGAKLTYKDDIVFNKLKAHLGVFSVSKYDGLVSPDYAVYTSTGKTDLKYLEYLFKTPQCISEFRKRSTGVGEGLTRLYTGELFSIYIPFPEKKTQKNIANFLVSISTAIDTAIEQKQKLIEKLTEYKKSLIYEVVTGKKEI